MDTADLRNAILDLLVQAEDDAAALGLALQAHPEAFTPAALEDLLDAARAAAGRLGALRVALPAEGDPEAGGDVG